MVSLGVRLDGSERTRMVVTTSVVLAVAFAFIAFMVYK